MRFHNRTGTDLIPYPVVTSPPPPHRERDVDGRIPRNCSATVDSEGFNLVLTNEDYGGSGTNGVFLGFDTSTSPLTVLVRRLRYKVAPGQEGSNSSLQPEVIQDEVVEVAVDGDVTVDSAWQVSVGVPSEKTYSLDVYPPSIQGGGTVRFSSCGGISGNVVRVHIMATDGVPENTFAFQGNYDSNGMWTHDNITPTDPNVTGKTYTFQLFTKDEDDKAFASNTVDLTIL